MTTFFLHGLDSSGKGTKGTYFEKHFPHVRCPDFFGSLEERLEQLTVLCENEDNLTLIGSSFGGLMATCYAIANTSKINQLILLAPALNFEEFTPPVAPIATPTLLIVGEEDVVCPPELVLPQAEKTFQNLEVLLVDDDHLLHNTFQGMGWTSLIP